jgi:phospholipase D1/2
MRRVPTSRRAPRASSEVPAVAARVVAARRTRFGVTRRIGGRALALLALLLVVAASWWLLPEASRPTIAELLAIAERGRASPLAPLVALVCFAIGGVVVFPINLLIAATIVVFGPWAGAAYALAGSILSAEVVYDIGRLLPASVFARAMGARGERLRAKIVDYGFLAVALVRLVPIAPYSVVSLIAGAARVRRVGYWIGTALGMLPGIILYALFVDRARAALLDPHPLTWLALAAALALMIVVALLVRRHASGTASRDDAQ